MSYSILCYSCNFSTDNSYENDHNYYHPNLLLVHPNAKFWNEVWYIMHPNNLCIGMLA